MFINKKSAYNQTRILLFSRLQECQRRFLHRTLELRTASRTIYHPSTIHRISRRNIRRSLQARYSMAIGLFIISILQCRPFPPLQQLLSLFKATLSNPKYYLDLQIAETIQSL